MKIDPLLVIGLGGVAAWLGYNWWQNSKNAAPKPPASQCLPVQIDVMNQTGAFIKSLDPSSAQLTALRNQITACGGTPTF